MGETFTFNDGWLLVSLWGAKYPCDIEKVRHYSDFFNHAVINDDQALDSVRHLEMAGMAGRDKEGLFFITEKGSRYVDERWNGTEGHIKLFLRIARGMERTPIDGD